MKFAFIWRMADSGTSLPGMNKLNHVLLTSDTIYLKRTTYFFWHMCTVDKKTMKPTIESNEV